MKKQSKAEHIEQHKKLHDALDELLADFLNHTKNLPTKTSLMELLNWSYLQTTNPDEKEAT